MAFLSYPSPHILHLLLLVWASQVEPRTMAPKPDHKILYELLTSHITSLLLATPKFSERSADSPASTFEGMRDLTQGLGTQDSIGALTGPARRPTWPHLHLTFMGQQTKFKGRTRKRAEEGLLQAWGGQHWNQQDCKMRGDLEEEETTPCRRHSWETISYTEMSKDFHRRNRLQQLAAQMAKR